jgi:hypothetical protein
MAALISSHSHEGSSWPDATFLCSFYAVMYKAKQDAFITVTEFRSSWLCINNNMINKDG